MKKIALVLAVLLCALPMMAFAEVAATGSVSFSIGNTDETDTTGATFTGAKSATATISVASEDEKVVATVGLDLLPAVTSTFNYNSGTYWYEDDASGLQIKNWIDGYLEFVKIGVLVDFWNDNYSYDTALDVNAFADYDTVSAGLLAAINGASTNIENADGTVAGLAYLVADGTLTIRDAEEADGAYDDVSDNTEFIFTNAAANDMAAILAAAVAYMDGVVDAAIATICDDADKTVAIDALTTGAALVTYINGLTAESYQDLSTLEKEILEVAADLYIDYQDAVTPDSAAYTVDSAINYITSASLSFLGVADVLDITLKLAGSHVAAGAISVDAAGHSSTSVGGYPSIAVGLSSGVVDGLNAGLSFYIDDNDVDLSSDKLFTFTDEHASYDVDPVYGLGVNAGYTMAMDDMSVGADVALGLYDLMGGDDFAWAFSIAPAFSGFGANVGLQFDMGLDMMYFMASVDYTIMGITPNVAFYYANATGDYVLDYNSSYATVMGAFLDGSDGMLIAGGLDVDLSDLIGMGVSLSGGVEYGLSGQAATELAWNAGLSVADLVEGLTAGFNCSADSVERTTVYDGSVATGFDWDVNASYAYGIATLMASIGSDYNSADECNYLAWTVGTSVSF